MEEKTLYIERKDLLTIMKQIDIAMSNIEVKGESVKHLFDARLLFKELFGSIKGKETDTENKEES